jgi:hypothetical protein
MAGPSPGGPRSLSALLLSARLEPVIDLTSYVNKTTDFKFSGSELRFDLSHALFSSFDVDQGTKLLLKAVARDPVLARARRVLDEGCGVGVIGLSVAKAFPEAEVVLRDRDSLAVAFAERNRLANKLRGTTAWENSETGERREARPAPIVEWGLLADGAEDIRDGSRVDGSRGYDFVLSNLPAKAGAPVLAAFFKRLSGLLAPGGRAGIVIVKPLAEAAAAWIAEAGLSVVATARGTGHNVFIVELPAGTGLGEVAASSAAASSAEAPRPLPEAYFRGEARFKLGDLSYRAHGFWSMAEFDTPGWGSLAAADAAFRALAPGARVGRGAAGEALFLDPGVGHLAVWAARVLGLKRLVAASRDKLSLEATRANIAGLPERLRPEYEAMDALGVTDLPPGSFDLLAESPDIVPERDWVGPSWALAERLVRPGGAYLVFCPPTDMTRLEKRRPSGGERPSGSGRWSLACQRRKKGFVASVWKRSEA